MINTKSSWSEKTLLLLEFKKNLVKFLHLFYLVSLCITINM
uniref:Uncharacterized protein n=1 Tax=Anguilla anguilla TaxID=7936 RepID=A0A0E9Q2G0_ANGAN